MLTSRKWWNCWFPCRWWGRFYRRKLPGKPNCQKRQIVHLQRTDKTGNSPGDSEGDFTGENCQENQIASKGISPVKLPVKSSALSSPAYEHTRTFSDFVIFSLWANNYIASIFTCGYRKLNIWSKNLQHDILISHHKQGGIFENKGRVFEISDIIFKNSPPPSFWNQFYFQKAQGDFLKMGDYLNMLHRHWLVLVILSKSNTFPKFGINCFHLESYKLQIVSNTMIYKFTARRARLRKKIFIVFLQAWRKLFPQVIPNWWSRLNVSFAMKVDNQVVSVICNESR